MILADTSVWVHFFRAGHAEMRRLLENGQVVMHPFIAAELALGSLRDRHKTLALLDSLQEVDVAQLGEVRHMIETHKLYSRGIGLVDTHLLASCLLTQGTRLWTRDNALRNAAKLLGVLADLA